MKHVVRTAAWEFEKKPFPAFRCFNGRMSQEFLMVCGIVPVNCFVVTTDSGKNLLYKGWSRAEAEAKKKAFDDAQKAQNRKKRAAIKSGPDVLPNGSFRIVRTKSGLIKIVAGKDETDRCLLFIGRKDSELLPDGTTGTVIARTVVDAEPHPILRSGHFSSEVVALLEPGQSVAFVGSGIPSHPGLVFAVFAWDGKEIEEKLYTEAEWNARTEIAEEGEEL